MPKIVITEQDNTSPGISTAVDDVVYIPGFVNINKSVNPNLYSVDPDSNESTYIGIKPHVPTQISSLSEFTALCGKEPAYFDKAQRYSDLVTLTADGDFTGFDSYAVPYHDLMFAEGQADPGYVMAKEMLAAGLTIVYERVNDDSYDVVFEAGSEAPADWNTSYTDYEQGMPVYYPITDSNPPTGFIKQNGYKYLGPTTEYFTKVAVVDPATVSTGNSGSPTILFKSLGVESTGTTYIRPQTKMENGVEEVQAAFGDLVPEYYIKDETYFALSPARTIVNPAYALKTLIDNPKQYMTPPAAQTSTESDESTSKSKPTKSSSLNGVVIKREIGSTGYFTVVPDISKEDYTQADLFNYYHLEFINITEQTSVSVLGAPADAEKVSGYVVPSKWINNYTNGVQVGVAYQTINPSQSGTAPEYLSTVPYRRVSDGIDIKHMYAALETIYQISETGISDRGNYNIKYLTSGGYPTYEYSQNSLVTKMLNMCASGGEGENVGRGDCVALIDHTDNPYRNQNIDQVGSLYNTVVNDLTFQSNGDFGAMFTNWCIYNRATTDLDAKNQKAENYDPTIRMPGSYAYLLSLANSITVNPNWLAIAGVSRGLVRNLAQNGIINDIPNGTADKMTPRDATAINPITNIKPYGYTIWGNRTLKMNAVNLTATSFLNIRNLVSDIKKEVYRACRKLTFEQNNEVLWINFKAEISPLLDRMLHGYGISSYRLLIDTDNPHYNEKATLCVKILLSPIEPVEDFYVSIVLQDDENVTITE